MNITLRIVVTTMLFVNLIGVSYAQTENHSNNASGKKRCVVFRPDLSYGYGIGEKEIPQGTIFELHATIDYQFNSFFAFGGGFGVNHFLKYGSFSSVPFFVHLRTYLLNKKWSPFLDIKYGYNISIRDSDNIKDTDHWKQQTGNEECFSYYQYSMNDYWYSGMIGVQYKNYDFGCSVGKLNMNYHVQQHCDGKIDEFDNTTRQWFISLSVAYNIQTKK